MKATSANKTFWKRATAIIIAVTTVHLELVTPVGQVEFLSCLYVCFVTSCFILKINSPLVSGSLPFLMCHQSDCLPWFLIVSTCSPTSLMCTYSLCLPLSRASVSCPFVLHTSLIAIVKLSHSIVCPEPRLEYFVGLCHLATLCFHKIVLFVHPSLNSDS